MIFANAKELRLNTAKLLEKTDKGEQVLITYRGKPRAVLQGITEDDLEDYILLNHPKLKARIKQAYKESLTGKTIALDELLAKTKKKLAHVSGSSHQDS